MPSMSNAFRFKSLIDKTEVFWAKSQEHANGNNIVDRCYTWVKQQYSTMQCQNTWQLETRHRALFNQNIFC